MDLVHVPEKLKNGCNFAELLTTLYSAEVVGEARKIDHSCFSGGCSSVWCVIGRLGQQVSSSFIRFIGSSTPSGLISFPFRLSPLYMHNVVHLFSFPVSLLAILSVYSSPHSPFVSLSFSFPPLGARSRFPRETHLAPFSLLLVPQTPITLSTAL